jgi:hypothetical protein
MAPMEVSSLKDIFSIVTGVLGTLAFLWKVWDTITSHTQIDLEIQALDPDASSSLTALLSVENNGLTPKRIDYAALMFGPSNITLRDMAQLIAGRLSPNQKRRRHLIMGRSLLPEKLRPVSNDMQTIFLLKPAEPFYDEVARDVALIPVPFFYVDQIHIGNERLKYRLRIDGSRLGDGRSYTVFFVVFAKHAVGYLRWRSTAELAVVKMPATNRVASSSSH